MALTPKVIDTFTFFNENDLLALRMEEMRGIVDKHVLVSSNQTFRGDSKPDYLDYERFQDDIDSGRLLVWNLHRFPRFMDTWGREEWQRNEIEVALETLVLRDGDMIILTDVDEVPSRDSINTLKVNWHHMPDIIRFRLKKFSYAINMLTDEGNTAARAFNYALLKDRTPQELRKAEVPDLLEDAGWEFSSLGTPEDIYLKLTSFAHSEFDHMISPEYLAKQIAAGKDLLGREIGMRLVEVDDTWPRAVVRDRAYWAKYELYLEGDTKCYPLDL